MKYENKEFMGIPIITINHPDHDEMVLINLWVEVLKEDLSDVISKIKGGVFEDSVIFFDSDIGKNPLFFISIKMFFGWVFESFSDNPLLKEFMEIASTVIKDQVKEPLNLPQN